MLLTLKVLNDDTTLNNWIDEGGAAQVVRGTDDSLVLQLVQADRKIRYIPASGATASLTLINSDQTTVTISGVFFLSPDDRSIIKFPLSAAQTANIISQNLVVTLAEGLNTNIAVLPLGLQMISPTQVGC